MLRSAIPLACRHLGPAEVHNANGYGRWCIDCGKRTDGLARDENVSRFNWVVALAFAGALAAVVVFFLVVNHGLAPVGPVVTPSTYPNPPVVHSAP